MRARVGVCFDKKGGRHELLLGVVSLPARGRKDMLVPLIPAHIRTHIRKDAPVPLIPAQVPPCAPRHHLMSQPSYAQPSYAQPAYAQPAYAQPSSAQLSTFPLEPATIHPLATLQPNPLGWRVRDLHLAPLHLQPLGMTPTASYVTSYSSPIG